MKRPTRKRAKVRAWDAFSLWVRLSNADINGNVKCFTCGRVNHYKETDAGHFIHDRLDYDEYNIHPQCTYCNRYRHGNLIEYTLRMVRLYGQEVVDELRFKSHQVEKYTIDELLNIEAKYKEKLKRL